MRLNIIAIACALAVSFGSAAAFAGKASVTLKVSGMTCASCPYMVKRSLTKIDGVETAAVSLETARAVVSYDSSKTTPVVLTAATTAAGFPSTVIVGDGAAPKSSTAITMPKPRGSN